MLLPVRTYPATLTGGFGRQEGSKRKVKRNGSFQNRRQWQASEPGKRLRAALSYVRILNLKYTSSSPEYIISSGCRRGGTGATPAGSQALLFSLSPFSLHIFGVDSTPLLLQY